MVETGYAPAVTVSRTPMLSSSSCGLAHRLLAREVARSSVRSSTTLHETPWWASAHASASPTGPAPTTTTSVSNPLPSDRPAPAAGLLTIDCSSRLRDGGAL